MFGLYTLNRLLLDSLQHSYVQLLRIAFSIVLPAEDMDRGPEKAAAVLLNGDPLLWHPDARDRGRRHGLGGEVWIYQASLEADALGHLHSPALSREGKLEEFPSFLVLVKKRDLGVQQLVDRRRLQFLDLTVFNVGHYQQSIANTWKHNFSIVLGPLAGSLI